MPINNINFRYIIPFLTSDLIIQTSSILWFLIRNYFGITNEVRDFFTNSEDEESSYFSFDAEEKYNLYKYEETTTYFMIKILQNKEFSFSVYWNIFNLWAEVKTEFKRFVQVGIFRAINYDPFNWNLHIIVDILTTIKEIILEHKGCF